MAGVLEVGFGGLFKGQWEGVGCLIFWPTGLGDLGEKVPTAG